MARTCFPLPLTMLLVLLFSRGATTSAQLIFADGFESGDVSAWSGYTGTPPCYSGLAASSALEGDLGSAPGGAFTELACLEVRNDQTVERRGELAFSGVPIPQSANLLDTGSLALVGPGNRRLAAQFDVLSRWGGTLDDASRPIRWLEVSLLARVAASSSTFLSLRRYTSLPAANDGFAVSVTQPGSDVVVDTGLATFTLDPTNPALFEAIAVDPDDDGQGRVGVYSHTAGAGPRLIFDSGTLLDTSVAGRVSVDAGGFEVVRAGPVQAVVVIKGHFSAPGGASLCTPNGLSYERFGYSLALTLVRGSRDLHLKYHVRNECSDGGDDNVWDDDAVTIEQASWEMPFAGLGTATHYYAGGGGVGSSAAGYGGVTEVEQRRGGGTPWARRARVRMGGVVQENGEAFERPLVGLADAELVVAAQLSWMRYREPQALVLDDRTLSLRVVSEGLVVGEGKGLWNQALVSLTPSGLVSGGTAAFLEALRDRLRRGLERGLLVRASREDVNRSGIYPSLGTDAGSPVKTAYLAIMNALHEETVSADPAIGQWHRSNTYGSQIWPDIQTDPYILGGPTPADNNVAMNYWNPSGAELLEFFRSGDPKWVWEFAEPQSWLQTFTAYLNVGDWDHSNRNGVAVNSGGFGEGHWHRNAGGSDDYTYDMGQDEAYVIRPCPLHRDRFAQAGRNLVDRYGVPAGSRDIYLNSIDLTRGVVQHYELLANCAEFVPGQQGADCLARLQSILAELANDNLRPGHLCQSDTPSPTTCSTPQQFMTNSLMYPFLHRMLRNYGDPTGLLQRGLVGAARHFYDGTMKQVDGTSLLVDVDAWPSTQVCTLDGAGDVDSCVPGIDSDGRNYMWAHNMPHSAALMLIGHDLDPSLGLCAIVKAAFDDPNLTDFWNDQMVGSGWVKGTSQMMQLAIFGVGLYDVCTDP